jgi:hypothetical protein
MNTSPAGPNQVAHSVPPHSHRHLADAQQLADSAPPKSEPWPYGWEETAARDPRHNYEIRVYSFEESNEPKNEEATVIVPVAITTATDDDTWSSPIYHQSDEDLRRRQGHKFCYCCCDYRRAVIIINMVFGVLEALLLILLATGTYGLYHYNGGGSTSLANEYSYETIEIIFGGISIILSSVAIFGACYYKIILVGLNVLWLVVAYVLGIIFAVQYCSEFRDNCGDYYYCTCTLNVGSVIGAGVVMCLYVYPHIGFIVQVYKGIMSRETYPREEYCCCCV